VINGLITILLQVKRNSELQILTREGAAMPGEIERKATWHGDMVKARDRIQALHRVLGAFESYTSLLVQYANQPSDFFFFDFLAVNQFFASLRIPPILLPLILGLNLLWASAFGDEGCSGDTPE